MILTDIAPLFLYKVLLYSKIHPKLVILLLQQVLALQAYVPILVSEIMSPSHQPPSSSSLTSLLSHTFCTLLEAWFYVSLMYCMHWVRLQIHYVVKKMLSLRHECWGDRHVSSQLSQKSLFTGKLLMCFHTCWVRKVNDGDSVCINRILYTEGLQEVCSGLHLVLLHQPHGVGLWELTFTDEKVGGRIVFEPWQSGAVIILHLNTAWCCSVCRCLASPVSPGEPVRFSFI